MHRAGKICVTKLLGLAFQLVEPRSFKPLAGIYQINNELFQQVESVALRGDFFGERGCVYLARRRRAGLRFFLGAGGFLLPLGDEVGARLLLAGLLRRLSVEQEQTEAVLGGPFTAGGGAGEGW